MKQDSESKRTVISKWAKKPFVMVVYKTKLPNGKYTSITKHEKA